MKLPPDLEIILEAPIDREDAKQRGFPFNISKLIIRANSKKISSKVKRKQKISELLIKWGKVGESLIAQPINLFLSLPRLDALLRQHNLKYQQASSCLFSINCNTPTEALLVLEKVDAEAIVFFHQTNPTRVREIESRVINCADSDSQYERCYLDGMIDYEGFAFYADTHESIEILGTHEMVVDRLMQMLGSDGNGN